MRVLQIIDSLDAGGAERMAVNFANGLSDKVEYSGLVVTRKEGNLKEQLKANISYFFLSKKNVIDLKAIFLLTKVIKENKIDVLHAHSSSYFIAVLAKLFCFKLKIIFHEHNGNKHKHAIYKSIPLILCIPFFSRILVVNYQLEKWYKNIGTNKVIYFSNFASFENSQHYSTILNGIENKKIVLLANFKNPKNHIFVIKAFSRVFNDYKDWTLHFVGKIHNDEYYNNMVELIRDLELENSIFIYDSKTDVLNILEQATIGVLCSTYEGFPVTILEYGLAKLPVIVSNVGYCSQVVIDGETGFLFESNNNDDFCKKICELIVNTDLRIQMGKKLNKLVIEKYGKDKVISELISIYISK